MKSKHLKQEVVNVFRDLIAEDFTVGQAIALYMNSSARIHTDLKPARQFIHRNILRLVESGELEKVSSEGRQKYRVTAQFNLRLVADQAVFVNDAILPDIEVTKSLTERLSHQKLELLTAMGEAEEYDAVYKEIPEMRGQIQPLYNNSRERCSKLLGKVKALENLISLSAR